MAIAHGIAGDLDLADEHFAIALEWNRGQGAVAMALRTKVDWARALCASERVDMVARGSALAQEAEVESAHRWPSIAKDASDLVDGVGQGVASASRR